MDAARKKLTIPDLAEKKRKGERLVFAAGKAGTCQALNGADLIGSFDTFKPKFAKRYGNVAEVACNAFAAYAEEVRARAFPDDDHTYKMKPEEAEKFAAALSTETKP